MSYASAALPLQPSVSLPVSAAQIWRVAVFGFESIVLAIALWGCLALPGFLSDGCSVTTHHVRIASPQ